jgi:hypothetical protein
MLPQVSGQPGNATGAAATAAATMNIRWNAGATIFFASVEVERVEESSSILLRMLLQSLV